MTGELITVVIVNYNTSSFLELSLFALAKLTKNKYKVIVCDNGSSCIDKRKLRRIANKYDNVELMWREQSIPDGMGHGEALNILIEKINTAYGSILDADATFLKKGWDEILLNQLNNKVKIIGAPPVKGSLKPIDFPLTYAVLFENEVFKSLKIDMRPTNPKVGQDVGWEMREKFLKHGYAGKALEVRSTRVYKDGPFKNVICAEYYLRGCEDILACHFGRGSSLGAAKYKEWNRFLSLRIVNYIARKAKGYKEKGEWLAICREIIERQLHR
jgi:glycosyltransferase involved in cell wall biosynthesis